MPIIEAFSQAISEHQKVTLVTFTGGPSVLPWQLKDRLQGMSRALRRWKRKAAREGVEGGVYAWEVTQNGDRLHLHLHISLVYDPSCEWAVVDREIVKEGAKNGDLTPALVWLALGWSSALEREAPDLYAALPLWRSLLPSMSKRRERLYDDPVEAVRGAVCDIGDRWPDPKRKGEPISQLGAGDTVKNLEQTVKYAVKNGAEIDSQGWMHIMDAFSGRRRIQGFGCLHGVKPPAGEKDIKRSELTGNAAAIGGGRVNMISDVLKSFLWGSSISHITDTGNREITWFRCCLEEVE